MTRAESKRLLVQLDCDFMQWCRVCQCLWLCEPCRHIGNTLTVSSRAARVPYLWTDGNRHRVMIWPYDTYER